jgi:hypothetical protein
MAHQLDFIQNHDVETVLTTLYVLVDDAYPLDCAALGWKRRERGKEPRFTDSKVLTIVYYAELYHGGNETLGWSFIHNNFQALFPDLMSRTRFHRRRRAVDFLIEPIRRVWLGWLHLDEDAERIMDSLPTHFCQYVRGKGCRLIHAQDNYGPDEFFGRAPSKREQRGKDLCALRKKNQPPHGAWFN